MHAQPWSRILKGVYEVNHLAYVQVWCVYVCTCEEIRLLHLFLVLFAAKLVASFGGLNTGSIIVFILFASILKSLFNRGSFPNWAHTKLICATLASHMRHLDAHMSHIGSHLLYANFISKSLWAKREGQIPYFLSIFVNKLSAHLASWASVWALICGITLAHHGTSLR